MAEVEIWRGGVNTWECDEMGHMNVRFYVARAQEGLAGLAMRLGLPHAFAVHADATLIVREHHVRFLREAHAGAALHMTGGVVSMGESDALLLQVIVHSLTGEPCATFLTRVSHATARVGRVFPWPSRTREAAEALRMEVPAHAAPRSISGEPVESQASLARADEMGLVCIGRGALDPRDCDGFGRMRPEHLMGRVSDGVPALLTGVRAAVAAAAAASGEAPRRVGGAVLEYRLVYLELPHAGDHLELRSGLAGFEAKTQRLNHWLLDPLTGAAWATTEAVAINFDLDARKAVPIAPAAIQALRGHVREGLGL